MSFSAGSTIARASSGSMSSIRSIDPLMSANSAVTVFRSPSIFSAASASAIRIGGASGFFAATDPDAPKAAPQSAQNLAPGALSEPHREQRFDNGPPHSAQNFLPGIPSVPHFEQHILFTQERGWLVCSTQSYGQDRPNRARCGQTDGYQDGATFLPA